MGRTKVKHRKTILDFNKMETAIEFWNGAHFTPNHMDETEPMWVDSKKIYDYYTDLYLYRGEIVGPRYFWRVGRAMWPKNLVKKFKYDKKTKTSGRKVLTPLWFKINFPDRRTY